MIERIRGKEEGEVLQSAGNVSSLGFKEKRKKNPQKKKRKT